MENIEAKEEVDPENGDVFENSQDDDDDITDAHVCLLTKKMLTPLV